MVLSVARLNIGANLRTLRERKGMPDVRDAAARAKALGFTTGQSTIYDLEAGKRRLTQEMIRVLAQVYEVTEDELVVWSVLGEMADTLLPAMFTPQLRRLMEVAGSLDEEAQDDLLRRAEEAARTQRSGDGPPSG